MALFRAASAFQSMAKRRPTNHLYAASLIIKRLKIRAPLTGCVTPQVRSGTANAGSASWPFRRECGASSIWMFIPSTVPMYDCFRFVCDDWWRKVTAIDVGRNELRGGVAGQPAAFALATREFMVAIANF